MHRRREVARQQRCDPFRAADAAARALAELGLAARERGGVGVFDLQPLRAGDKVPILERYGSMIAQ